MSTFFRHPVMHKLTARAPSAPVIPRAKLMVLADLPTIEAEFNARTQAPYVAFRPEALPPARTEHATDIRTDGSGSARAAAIDAGRPISNRPTAICRRWPGGPTARSFSRRETARISPVRAS